MALLPLIHGLNQVQQDDRSDRHRLPGAARRQCGPLGADGRRVRPALSVVNCPALSSLPALAELRDLSHIIVNHAQNMLRTKQCFLHKVSVNSSFWHPSHKHPLLCDWNI